MTVNWTSSQISDIFLANCGHFDILLIISRIDNFLEINNFKNFLIISRSDKSLAQ